jgi:hypothetical protein
MLAATNNRLACVRALIAAGAELEEGAGVSACGQASAPHSESALPVHSIGQLSRRARLRARTALCLQGKGSALVLAGWFGNHRVATALLAAGAEPETCDKVLAAAQAEHPSLRRRRLPTLLRFMEGIPHVSPQFNRTALYLAADEGYLATVGALLAGGVNPNTIHSVRRQEGSSACKGE